MPNSTQKREREWENGSERDRERKRERDKQGNSKRAREKKQQNVLKIFAILTI